MYVESVFFDFDDVIKPLIPAWTRVIEQMIGEKIPYESITNFARLGDEKYLRLLDHIPHEEGDPEPGVVRVVRCLVRRGIPVYVISATPESNIVAKTNWLDRHLPEIPRKNRIWCSCKHLCAGPGRVLVDDAIHNLEAWELSGGTSICMDRPWNQEWDGLRVRTMAELAILFDNLLSKAV